MNTKAALHCDVVFQTMSVNGQIRAESVAIVFWNQGNTEVVINGNIRLAAATLVGVTTTTPSYPIYAGGEAYRVEHPNGRMVISDFDVIFTPGSNLTNTQPDYNNLRIQMLRDLDNAHDVA